MIEARHYSGLDCYDDAEMMEAMMMERNGLKSV